MSIKNPSTALPVFSLIGENLKQVRKMISQQLSTPDGAPEIADLLLHISDNTGKMLRPGLVLLTGVSCGEINDLHITVAGVVEMIHTATLLHDDVIDEGLTRRGKPTINSRWGNESAVLLGDFLLSRVFRI